MFKNLRCPVTFEFQIHNEEFLFFSISMFYANIWKTNWTWASLVVQMVKNLSVMWKIQVQSLGRDDPMENGMATHSSILAWRIPWTEEPGRLYSPWGCKESDMTEKLNFHFSLFILNKQKPKKLLFI